MINAITTEIIQVFCRAKGGRAALEIRRQGRVKLKTQ